MQKIQHIHLIPKKKDGPPACLASLGNEVLKYEMIKKRKKKHFLMAYEIVD